MSTHHFDILERATGATSTPLSPPGCPGPLAVDVVWRDAANDHVRIEVRYMVGEQVVATRLVALSLQTGKSARAVNFEIAPAFRGHGLGTYLQKNLLDSLAKDGVEVLRTLTGNAGTRMWRCWYDWDPYEVTANSEFVIGAVRAAALRLTRDADGDGIADLRESMPQAVGIPLGGIRIDDHAVVTWVGTWRLLGESAIGARIIERNSPKDLQALTESRGFGLLDTRDGGWHGRRLLGDARAERSSLWLTRRVWLREHLPLVKRRGRRLRTARAKLLCP